MTQNYQNYSNFCCTHTSLTPASVCFILLLYKMGIEVFKDFLNIGEVLLKPRRFLKINFFYFPWFILPTKYADHITT